MLVHVLLAIGAFLPSPSCEVYSPTVSDWRQHSLLYVESEHMYVVAGPTINEGQSVITIPADSGETVKSQEIMGAGTQNPPPWDSRFSPLKTPAQTVANEWSHETIQLQPRFGFEHRSIWRYSTGYQQFERYDDNVPTGLMLRRDRDWWEPFGEEEHIWEAIQPGGGGGSN